MSDNDPSKKDLEERKPSSSLAKIVDIPIGAKASIEIMVDRANAEARIKIIEADIIIKYGLLRKKKGED